MARLARRSLVAAIALVAAATTGRAGGGEPPLAPAPRLIVWITVDQLRGDVLPRLEGRFGPGGFRRWLDGGAVLSSNHGTGAIPAHAAALGEITGEMPDDEELTARANAALRAALDVESDLVAWYECPGFALDRQALARARLATDRVAPALALEGVRSEGVRAAFTHAELRGDDAAMHGSPYAHDTWVPVAFVAPCRAGSRALSRAATGGPARGTTPARADRVVARRSRRRRRRGAGVGLKSPLLSLDGRRTASYDASRSRHPTSEGAVS